MFNFDLINFGMWSHFGLYLNFDLKIIENEDGLRLEVSDLDKG